MAKFSGFDQLSSIIKNPFTLKFVVLPFESVDKILLCYQMSFYGDQEGFDERTNI